MINEVDDSQYLEMLGNWIEQMHKQGRFNACEERGPEIIREMVERINRIATKVFKYDYIEKVIHSGNKFNG